MPKIHAIIDQGQSIGSVEFLGEGGSFVSNQVFSVTSEQTGSVRENVILERCDDGLHDIADPLMIVKSEYVLDLSIRSAGPHPEEEDDECLKNGPGNAVSQVCQFRSKLIKLAGQARQ